MPIYGDLLVFQGRLNSNLSGTVIYFLRQLMSNNDSNKIQLITDNVSSDRTVDNSIYYYTINYYPPKTDTAGLKQRIYGCRIEYSFE